MPNSLPPTADGLSLEAWLLAAFTLVVAGSLGFCLGLFYERTALRRAFARAKKHAEQLLGVVHQRLDSAEEACTILHRMPELALTGEQTEQLGRQQSRLSDLLAELIESQRARLTTGAASEDVARREPFQVAWIRTPESAETGLPDRSALVANLEAMAAAGRAAERTSGVLLIRVDRLDSLRERFGAAHVQGFVKSIVRLACQSLRDDDVLCEHAPDTLAAILADVSPETGRRIAESIRTAIRRHRFRLAGSETEVLVTASFGYADSPIGDDPVEALDRAVDAVSRSQRQGRNQLHVHDGETVRLCAAVA